MQTKRFLIIDDDDDIRDYYKTIISNHLAFPHEIVEFSAANETIQYLKENKVDLIILDYQLADTNGISLLKYLRKLTSKFTPIIMLTGKGNETIAATAIKYGAADYLVKNEITPNMLISVIEDTLSIAEKKKAGYLKRKRLHHHLHFDNQTGFINRQTFEIIATDVLKKTLKHNRSMAMMLVKIDSNELTVDMISRIAEVLTSTLPNKSVIARNSENEFVIIIAGHSAMANIISIANKIVSDIAKFNVNHVKLTPSMGIACYPDYNNIALLNDYTRFFSSSKQENDSDKPKEDHVEQLVSIYSAKLCGDSTTPEQEIMSVPQLMDHCRQSLARAVNSGGNCFEIFREHNYSKQYRELEVELALHEAINTGSNALNVVYMPISFLRDKKQIGFEIRLNWKDPRLGIITYNEFIPTAKRLNVINHLDSYLTASSTHDFSKICRSDNDAINLSHVTLAVDFSLPKMNDVDLMDKISLFTQKAKLFSHHIELQISEETFNQLSLSAAEVKLLNKHLSFQLVLNSAKFDDHFFSQLSIIPISSIKISHDIVSTILSNKTSSIGARSIIQLGKELNTHVIADGIDNQEQYYFLLENGCTMGIGHQIGLPLRGNQLKDFVTSTRVYS